MSNKRSADTPTAQLGVPSFWQYAAVAHKLRADNFGDFVRLVSRRVLAHPREVNSLQELRATLAEARVEVSAETVRRVWSNFARHRDQRNRTAGVDKKVS